MLGVSRLFPANAFSIIPVE